MTLLDTAGMRETGDPVEMEGVRRARARAAAADLVLWVEDVSGGEGGASEGDAGSAPSVGALEADDQAGDAGSAPALWLVRNKIDLVTGAVRKSKSGNVRGSKSECNDQVMGSNESTFQTNRPLTNLVN